MGSSFPLMNSLNVVTEIYVLPEFRRIIGLVFFVAPVNFNS
jgi:hypothetical protein